MKYFRAGAFTNMAIIIVVVVVFVSGCASMQARKSDDTGVSARPLLGVASNLRFEDIPVPNGFSLARTQSFIYQDGSTRIGRIRYIGRSRISDVMRFFKDRMAVYNWDLQNVIEYEYAVLNYRKPNETCTITVMPLATKTMIDVVLTPKGGSIDSGTHRPGK